MHSKAESQSPVLKLTPLNMLQAAFSRTASSWMPLKKPCYQHCLNTQIFMRIYRVDVILNIILTFTYVYTYILKDKRLALFAVTLLLRGNTITSFQTISQTEIKFHQHRSFLMFVNSYISHTQHVHNTILPFLWHVGKTRVTS